MGNMSDQALVLRLLLWTDVKWYAPVWHIRTKYAGMAWQSSQSAVTESAMPMICIFMSTEMRRITWWRHFRDIECNDNALGIIRTLVSLCLFNATSRLKSLAINKSFYFSPIEVMAQLLAPPNSTKLVLVSDALAIGLSFSLVTLLLLLLSS